MSSAKQRSRVRRWGKVSTIRRTSWKLIGSRNGGKSWEKPEQGRVANQLRKEVAGELATTTEREKLVLGYCDRITGFSVSCALQEDGLLVLRSLGGQEILRN